MTDIIVQIENDRLAKFEEKAKELGWNNAREYLYIMLVNMGLKDSNGLYIYWKDPDERGVK